MKAEQYLKPEVLRQVARFDLKAKFLVEGFLAGLHRSPFKGFSVEFSEHRKYVPGDDIRTIDWQVFGRTNRFYVKQYQAETNLEAMLLVDASGSMAYGGRKAGGVTKLEYATYLAAALAHLMIAQQDPVGAVVLGDRLRQWIRPRTGRRHLLRILKTLAESNAAGPTRLAPLLHDVARRLPHRGLVVLASDLLEEPEPLLEALRHLRHRGHDVIVFHVLDADETRFAFDGACAFTDLETGETVQADADEIRASYLDAINEFTGRCRRMALRENIDYILMDTATPFDRALTGYLLTRSRR